MKPLKAAVYTRVSTADQHPEMQERELIRYVKRKGWTVYRIYTDKGVSGAKEKRPALDSLIEDCRRGKVDAVVVWKFDRFARSLKQLLIGLDLFRALGICFVSVTEAIDFSLPHQEALFQILGALSQLEKSLIAERVKAGINHARACGKRLGRPALTILGPSEIAALRKERRTRNTPYRDLAHKFGVSVWTAHRLCSGRQNGIR